VDATFQVAALAILLQERSPPHLEHPIRVAQLPGRVCRCEPAEGIELRVVDGVVKRQAEAARSVAVRSAM